jgi:predicted lysophospholipase L1 biosynthesis ABC-type transport system permease subunit
VVLSTAGWLRVDPSAREALQQGRLPFLVRFASGVPLERGVAGMRKDAPTGFIAPSERPGDVSSLARIANVPVLLAGLLAAMAIGVLAHTVITSIRRRRRDLAILKTLGFERRQLAGAVAWQATVLAAAGLVIGVPVGVAVGRWTWRAFADQLGVLPVPIIPVLAILIAVPSAVALANVIAVLPGRSAARTQAALVLRSE